MYFTTDIASELSKVPVGTIAKHVRTRKLSPAVRGNGQGKSHQFTEAQVFALYLSHGLLALGMGSDVVSKMLREIGILTRRQLMQRTTENSREYVVGLTVKSKEWWRLQPYKISLRAAFNQFIKEIDKFQH